MCVCRRFKYCNPPNLRKAVININDDEQNNKGRTVTAPGVDNDDIEINIDGESVNTDTSINIGDDEENENNGNPLDSENIGEYTINIAHIYGDVSSKSIEDHFLDTPSEVDPLLDP